MVQGNRAIGGGGGKVVLPKDVDMSTLEQLSKVDPHNAENTTSKIQGWLVHLQKPAAPHAVDESSVFRNPPPLQQTESELQALVQWGETNDGNSVISAGSDSDHESEAGDTLGAEQVFRDRLPLRIKMSDAVHRLLNTTSKYDKADIDKALAPFIDACQTVAKDFDRKYVEFDRNARKLKTYDAPHEVSLAIDCRFLMRQLSDQMEKMFSSVSSQYIEPARELVEQGLKNHRGRERLTRHDEQLISETFGASCLGQMDRQMKAARTAYEAVFVKQPLPAKQLYVDIHADPSSLGAAASIPEGRRALHRTESVASQRPSNASDRTLVQTPSAEPGASGAASSVQSSVVNVRL